MESGNELWQGYLHEKEPAAFHAEGGEFIPPPDDESAPPPREAHEAPPPLPLHLTDAQALMGMHFEPRMEPVRDMIVEGLTLLCGAPKVGKSWFILQMCCAIARGTPFLGHPTKQGSVLYLALEDSLQRLRERMQALNETASPALKIATDCGALTLETGLLDALKGWIKEADRPRMIVIDTLQKVRGASPGARQNAYEADYAAMAAVKRLADEAHVAIVLIHHTNKKQDVDDEYMKISGSNGLMGAADTTIMLGRERNSPDASVIITGRDVWESTLNIRREGTSPRWLPVDPEALEREKYESSAAVRTVRALLEQKPEPGRPLKITYADFMAAAMQYASDAPDLGWMHGHVKASLDAAAPLLYRYDGIRIVTGRRLRSVSAVEISRREDAGGAAEIQCDLSPAV